MADRFGALTLPVTAGEAATRLDVLLAFSKAVLVAQAQAAWADAAPLEPHEAVAYTRAEDPRRCAFPAPLELPALFAYESKATFEGAGDTATGDGYERAMSVVTMWWLFPPASIERRRPMDVMGQALVRALAAAIRDARHPAYVHSDDEADVDAVRVAAAAPLVDTTYSGAALDGAIGASAWPTPGRVTITTTAGAWDTSAPIAVTIKLPGTDIEHTELLFLTSATGPETVEAAWIGEQVVSVVVPGQSSAVGTLSVGSALAPACEHGSSLREKMGVHALRLVNASADRQLVIERAGGQAMKFDGVCFEIACEETRDRTADALGYEALDDTGMMGLLTSVDGGVSVEMQEL